jgi:hypothetical protein
MPDPSLNELRIPPGLDTATSQPMRRTIEVHINPTPPLAVFAHFDRFAEAAYRGFYTDDVRPFEQLDEAKKRTWRRVAASVLAAEHGAAGRATDGQP